MGSMIMKLWIARDEDNTLKLHFTGPYRYCDHYRSCGTVDETIDGIIIDNKLFPEVTFENSPQEIVLELPTHQKFTDEELNNPILHEMTWRVDTPALLNEIANCSNQGIYSPVMAIFGRALACIADRATQLNDPILNICMLKLKMYEVPHDLINDKIKEQLKRLPDGISTRKN